VGRSPENAAPHAFVRGLAHIERRKFAVDVVLALRRAVPDDFAEMLRTVDGGASDALRVLESELEKAMGGNRELLRGVMGLLRASRCRLQRDPIAWDGILNRELLTRAAARDKAALEYIVHLPGAPAELVHTVELLVLVCGEGIDYAGTDRTKFIRKVTKYNWAAEGGALHSRSWELLALL
jgi:hypothetical protein